MTAMFRVSSAAVLLTLGACGGGPQATRDAGTVLDGGGVSDGGTAPDGGTVPDGGTAPDGGTVADGGRPFIAPGEYDRTLTFDGRDRRYKLVVPPIYNGSTPLMLVLGLHAGGSGLGGFISITRIEDRARRDGFIAVFPNGLNFVEGSASWNAMHCCGAAHPQNVDDVGFIRALIDQLRRDLAVDSRRIFATGMSNGAMLAHRLAAELSDLIAGIGPVCGTIGGQEDVYASVKRPTTPARAVPVIAFNGLRDTAVPYAGGAGSDGDGRLDLSVAESMAFWTAANGCASTAPQVEMLFNGKVVRRTFPCPAGAEVVHYTMAEGDHSWPRPSQPGVPDGFFAEDYILPFFVAHPRP